MDHLWIPLTLVSAITLAASDALTKKALERHNEYLVIWLRILLSLPLILPLLLYIPVPPLSHSFFRTSLISLVLEVGATFLFMKALKLSPLSLTLPFLSLTPVFLLVIPFIMLGEKASTVGTVGIILIALGSYGLNIGEWRKGLLEPLRAIRREPGALCMIGVAFIYSFTSTLGKQAITLSSPIFFAATYYAAVAMALAPMALYMGRQELRRERIVPLLRSLALPAILNAAMVVTHMLAMSLTQVAYMIAVKRTSLLFGVAFGHFLLGESGLKERLAGAALMVVGAGLILLGH